MCCSLAEGMVQPSSKTIKIGWILHVKGLIIVYFEIVLHKNIERSYVYIINDNTNIKMLYQ